ncbi:MAG: hypothetical protein MOB07_06525 [Acidobacteria bacterium]|nr:hypothetical protein [Acidobacteriota bacterium]
MPSFDPKPPDLWLPIDLPDESQKVGWHGSKETYEQTGKSIAGSFSVLIFVSIFPILAIIREKRVEGRYRHKIMITVSAEPAMQFVNNLFASRWSILRAGYEKRVAVFAESEFSLTSRFINIAQDFARLMIILVWLETVVTGVGDSVQDKLLCVSRLDLP